MKSILTDRRWTAAHWPTLLYFAPVCSLRRPKIREACSQGFCTYSKLPARQNYLHQLLCQVRPHLLSEIDLHFCMQSNSLRILKPQVCSKGEKRWLDGFKRCSTNMPVHVCDSSGASLRGILPTKVFSLNDIWPLCQACASSLLCRWTPLEGQKLKTVITI